MSFDPLQSPIDYVVLSGRRSPGIATLSNASSPREWDERKGPQLSGAALVFKGIGVAKFTLELRLYTDAHWQEWRAWSPIVQRPPRGERANAMDIWHPILEDLGIRSVVVEDVAQPMQTADGEWTIEIKFIEYRAPQPAVRRADGQAAVAEVEGSIDQPGEAETPNQARIRLMRQRLEALNEEAGRIRAARSEGSE